MDRYKPSLSLAFGLSFEDLYERDGLLKIDAEFVRQLREADATLADRLEAARANPKSLDRKQTSELLIAVAPHLEDFIGELFSISTALEQMQKRHSKLAPIYNVKRKFVFKKALTGVKKEDADKIDGEAVADELTRIFGERFSQDAYVRHVDRWMQDEAANKDNLELAAQYARWAVLSEQGKKKYDHGLVFRLPRPLDPMNLIHLEPIVIGKDDNGKAVVSPEDHLRNREGFGLTDEGMDLTHALDHAHYCIKCHNQQKDSCSTGLREKDGSYRKSVFGITLAGCPLEEKISEMNVVKLNGYTVGALAIITVDNPMCAGTGHRICNDCMKGCVFQKQEPVDIPQVETRTLKDVLELPWGVEIYGLLTRWNPLNLARPVPFAPTGYKVLVVGLGPAGYTLAHHLMNDGHAVAAVDGLKIEPLEASVSGVDLQGNRVPFEPIYDLAELNEPLADRVQAGFGGVAEYGITVRWDKNFLKLIRLLLERRQQFAMYGGVRFGGTITEKQAFDAGFDHVALCMGAGRPTVVDMKNGLARGVRQASDFLMALQLTGAAREESVANLQLRLPVVVIGGGLTAIDTATEAQAYYIQQVEKFMHRYETLLSESSDHDLRKGWSVEENEVADEFLAHARAIRAERESARRARREPDFHDMIRRWGGVTIAYRRRLVDAPSYTLNHEEVEKALEEGPAFAENLTPKEVVLDKYGAAAAIKFDCGGDTIELPARSILVAAGTQPNTVLNREEPEHFPLDGKFFQLIDDQGKVIKPQRVSKPDEVYVLLERREDGRTVSFFGDLHPSFSGNVVKAMGGAKQGYPLVTRSLATRPPTSVSHQDLFAWMNDNLRATVHEVVRLTPTIVEVIVRAPLAARGFEPGQFYRLQNYEALAPKVAGTRLCMEGLALTGASVDVERGLVSVIVLEMGGSSDLCALLKPGEPVILMGPTGAPTEAPAQETVLLVGGGLGNAVLFSIGQKLRAAGSKVVYFAGYKKVIDRYKVEEIEKAADVIVWCCDEQPGFVPTRPQDRSIVTNIVEAMASYGRGDLGPAAIPLSEVNRVIAIGSDGMMRAVAQARHTVLQPFLRKDHVGVGSINSPMQCMMKEICAQCLQQHRDPVTGKETVVFSCFNQDQLLDHVDFGNLRARLMQNGVQERLTKMWIDRCLKELGERPRA